MVRFMYTWSQTHQSCKFMAWSWHGAYLQCPDGRNGLDLDMHLVEMYNHFFLVLCLMLGLHIWAQQYRLIFFRSALQLEFQLRIYSILEDQTSPQKFITKNMQTLESVDPTSGGSLLLSFWGNHISLSGTTVILSLMRWWVAWRMSMQLAQVKLTSMFFFGCEHYCTIGIYSLMLKKT